MNFETPDGNSKYLEIMYISSEIEDWLGYILDKNHISYNASSFQNKISKMCDYLDHRPNKHYTTRDKIFDNRYSLVDIFSNIKALRDTAVHDANNLITGLSRMPLKMRAKESKFSKKYVGDIDKLHKAFSQYSDYISKLYNMVQLEGAKIFEVFDIDGSQIGEY